MQIFRYFFRP